MNLIDSIGNEPQDWRDSEYSLVHKSGLRIWVANGMFHLKRNGVSTFPFMFKVKLWAAIRYRAMNYVPRQESEE